MPAETVEIRQGILLVDGVSLEENYVPQEYREGIDFPPQATPQGHYFVLEESRNGPADSRTWGAVPRGIYHWPGQLDLLAAGTPAAHP